MRAAGQWLRRMLRYRRIMKRVVADPATYTYFDEAMQPVTAISPDHFVEVFRRQDPEDPWRADRRHTAAPCGGGPAAGDGQVRNGA